MTSQDGMENGIFRDWYVVGGVFVVLFVSFGCAYAFPAFFQALQNEFDASRGDVSLVFSIAGFIFFGIGPVSGTIADKTDPRWVIGAGVVMVGLGVILAGLMPNIWLIYIAYGLGVGLGVGFAYVPAVGSVQRWFTRRRGFASGMAVTGMGVGTFAMPLFATRLMGLSSWRTAYLIMGIGAIALGLIGTRWIENSPEVRGLRPDGDVAAGAPRPAASPRAERDYGVREAFATGPFRILYVASFLLSIPLFVPFVHLTPYALDRGIDQVAAVSLVSLIGVGSIAGRFIMGPFADRLGRRQSLIGMFVGIALMFVLWRFTDDYWVLALFALIFGSCYGGYSALAPAVTIDYLGARSAGSLIGWLYTSVALGTLLGPTLAGYMFDYTGSYELTITVAAGLLFLAALLTLLLPDPVSWRAQQGVDPTVAP